MKMQNYLLGLAIVFLMAGCSTPAKVSQMEGRGKVQPYNAPFERVWDAAVSAAQMGDLSVLETDKSRGYISAKRGVQLETFGENVGIWVREVSPNLTEVEVVSRQAGPPVLFWRNWEKRILANIDANLTRSATISRTPDLGRE
jgi:hypothetical protein